MFSTCEHLFTQKLVEKFFCGVVIPNTVPVKTGMVVVMESFGPFKEGD